MTHNHALNARADKYIYRVDYSPEDEGYIGTVLELPGLSHFAETNVEAIVGIIQATKEALAILEEEGKHIPEPLNLRKYSGKFNVRISPTLHRKLTQNAALANQSLNQYIAQALERAA